MIFSMRETLIFSRLLYLQYGPVAAAVADDGDDRNEKKLYASLNELRVSVFYDQTILR